MQSALRGFTRGTLLLVCATIAVLFGSAAALYRVYENDGAVVYNPAQAPYRLKQAHILRQFVLRVSKVTALPFVITIRVKFPIVNDAHYFQSALSESSTKPSLPPRRGFRDLRA